MSYNSKKTIASIIAGVLVNAAYIIYALSKRSPASDDLKSWAVAMLVFIGIGVAAVIVVQILSHIILAVGIKIKEREQDDKTVERIIASVVVEDERDKIIGLKSAHIGYIIAGLGFVAMLISLAFGMSAVFALHIMFGAASFGSGLEGLASVYFYETGVGNG